MTFNLNFVPSESGGSEPEIIPATPPKSGRGEKSAAQVRRERVRKNRLNQKNDSTNIQQPTKRPGKIKTRTYHLQNGQKQQIAKCLLKNKSVKRIKLERNPTNDFILERLHKNITFLKNVLQAELVDWHIWNAINNAIYDMLPTGSNSGLYVSQARTAWKVYKMWTSRSEKEKSLCRLHRALQFLGNELPELKTVCNNTIRSVYDELFFTGVQPFTNENAIRRGLLDLRPPRFIVNGTNYEQQN